MGDSSSASAPRRQSLPVLLGLAVLVAVAFRPVAQHEFQIYDDWEYVVANDVVRQGLTADGFAWAFLKSHSSNWHPLTWLSHMVDVQLFGLKPAGHHVTNLVLHTFNTLLLFAFLRRSTGSVWRSALVAALFGLHPLHVQSVAWVAERKDVLSTFFGLLCLIAYARFAQGRMQKVECRSIWTWYGVALVLFALGLMSKPMLVTWPFVLLLLDVWPLGRASLKSGVWSLESRSLFRGLLLEKIPFFVLSGLSCVVTYLAQSKGGAVVQLEHVPLALRLENAVVAYARYLGKTFWPADLSVFYPLPQGWPFLVVAVATLLLIGCSVAAFKFAARRPYIFAGWFWYVGTLVPVIGVVQVGGQSIADRYTYVPLIGIFVVIAWGLAELVKLRPAGKWPAVGLAAGSVVLCFAVTRQCVAYWQNSETLFTQALRVTKDNYIAHKNLGLHYLHLKRYPEAIGQFEAALRLRPNYAAARNNLGTALAGTGQTQAALEQIREAVRLRPDLPEARVNLARLLGGQGQWVEAAELLMESVRAAPQHPEGQYSLGTALMELGRLEEAARYFQIALQLRPDYAEAMHGLGTVYLQQGKTAAALQQYHAAVAAKPDFAEAHNNLGLIAAGMGRTSEAVSHYETALRLNPNQLTAHLGLALVLEGMGRLDEAGRSMARALELSPDAWWVRQQMGTILAKQGRFAEALPHFAEAIQLQATNAQLRCDYGMALDYSGKTAEAMEQYRQAITLNPAQLEALNNLAWILATSPEAGLRNGEEAVRLATTAAETTKRREARFIGTLAAAYAEAGRFEDAIRTAEQARDLARQAGLNDIAARNEELLQLYRTGKPYRESSPPGG